MRSSVALQSFFSSADCSDVFLAADLRSNLCHYQSASFSWCHPDAPSWNTHQPLCLPHLRFSSRFFSCQVVYTQTHIYMHVRLHRFTDEDTHFEPDMLIKCTPKCMHVHPPTLTNHLLSEVDAAMRNERQISYFISLSLACFSSLLTCLAMLEEQELN